MYLLKLIRYYVVNMYHVIAKIGVYTQPTQDRYYLNSKVGEPPHEVKSKVFMYKIENTEVKKKAIRAFLNPNPRAKVRVAYSQSEQPTDKVLSLKKDLEYSVKGISTLDLHGYLLRNYWTYEILGRFDRQHCKFYTHKDYNSGVYVSTDLGVNDVQNVLDVAFQLSYVQNIDPRTVIENIKGEMYVVR